MLAEDAGKVGRANLVQRERVHVDQQVVVFVAVRGDVQQQDVLLGAHHLGQAMERGVQVAPVGERTGKQAGRVVLQYHGVGRGTEALREQRIRVLHLVAEHVFAAITGKCQYVQIGRAGDARRESGQRVTHHARLRVEHLLGRWPGTRPVAVRIGVRAVVHGRCWRRFTTERERAIARRCHGVVVRKLQRLAVNRQYQQYADGEREQDKQNAAHLPRASQGDSVEITKHRVSRSRGQRHWLAYQPGRLPTGGPRSVKFLDDIGQEQEVLRLLAHSFGDAPV